MSSPALLEVSHLRVEFPTRHGTLLALDDISFSIAPGEILGVVQLDTKESAAAFSERDLSVLAGLASIVPYLGLVLGVAAASVAALLQFGDWHPLLGVAAVFVAAQLLEGMYLTPKLVGDRIGLHPVAVILALLAFAQLFGFTGILLALPASAALLVWLRHLRAQYLASGMYQGGSREV